MLHLAVRLVGWFLGRVRDALAVLGFLGVLAVALVPDADRSAALRWVVGRLQDRLVASAPLPPLEDAPPIAWPVPTQARVSSGYGWRRHPVYGDRRFHNGVDLVVPIGTNVRTVAAGRVDRVGEDAVSGRYVVVLHDDHLRTAYCHLDAVVVVGGQQVAAGELLGRSGRTGRATGPHLHFGTWWRGRSVDPRRLPRSA